MRMALYYASWVIIGATLPLPGKTIGIGTALICGLAAFTAGALLVPVVRRTPTGGRDAE